MPSTVFSMLNAYSFAQHGHDVTIILKSPAGPINYDFESFFNLPKLNNFHIIDLSDTGLRIQNNEIFYRRANKFIQFNASPDVILTRDPGYLPFLYQLKRKLQVKIFYQSHNFYLNTDLQPDQKKINQKKYQRYEKKYIPKLDGLFTLNQSQKKLYEQYTSVPIYSVIPGLQNIFDSKDNFNNKLVAYSGSLLMKKGVDLLLHAFARLKKKSAKLVLIGGRHDREIEPVLRLAEELNITDRIKITGWISYAAVQKYLKKATVGILPLKDTFYNRYLTAPSKLFDYIAHGIPVIASDLPAIRDIDESHNSLIYTKPENVKQLTSKIDELLNNQNLYSDYSNRSHQLAKNYLWKNCGKRMLDKF